MIRRLVLALLLASGATIAAPAQGVPTEFQVKAAFLFNFVKYIEWSADAASGPVTICVAGRNPFGPVLADLVRGEVVAGRPVETRVIVEADPDCDVLYVAREANAPAYLRVARKLPTLIVGETANFIASGGHVRFYVNDGYVRFEINPEGAEQAGVRISSRVLKLARIVDGEGRPR